MHIAFWLMYVSAAIAYVWILRGIARELDDRW